MGVHWKSIFGGLLLSLILITSAHSLVGPIRSSENGNVIFVSSEEIKLVTETLELYHHPLGIWLVEYQAQLHNMQSREVTQMVGFPAGNDLRLIEGDLYCDRYEKFRVFVNDREISRIELMRRCSNYVKSTGTQWSTDEAAGIGFLNTWELKFKPEETKWITVTFNYIVKKAPAIYQPNVKEAWYVDLMNWLRDDYAARQENQLSLPISIGSFWSFYPDSIVIRTYVAKDWLRMVDKQDRIYATDYIKRFEFGEPVGFYSPPDIALESVTLEQLQKLSQKELIVLRNSFFAKYGRKFDVDWLRKYFQNQPWYSENPAYHNWYLTPWDLENIKFIHQYENRIN
ncbi:MAG: YARHG domain-containing protein [candidate division KSB1 bacterium]|nr:YARHG domain-containing protein [candidate division KSB1 bacterium]